MKKFCGILIFFCTIISLSATFSFATADLDIVGNDNILSIEVFKEDTDLEPDSHTSKECKCKYLSKDEIIDIILHDEEFNLYISTELENIYDSMVNFVLNRPSILKNFEDSLNITEPCEIRNFFEDLITSADIKNCLISLLDDPDFYDMFKEGNLASLIDAFYDTLTI